MLRSRAAAVGLFVLALACTRSADEGAAKPIVPPGTSLLLVTLDTTRRDFVSSYGADPRISPNLTRLGEEGTVFLEAFAQTNSTNPSHVTIMTGLPAAQHGVLNNSIPLSRPVDTLPELFQRAGFETAGFPSVRHVGQDLRWRGFDRLEPAEEELDAAAATGRILRWLESRSSEKPFFAWLHYWDPHTLYAPPPDVQRAFYTGDRTKGERRIADESFFGMFRGAPALVQWLGDTRDREYPRAMYAGEIHNVDREFGRVLAALDGRGLGARTAVVVLADHGESLGEHGIWYSHAGLYEPQLRIPFLARIPGFPKGLRPSIRVSQLDVFPTVAALFGLSPSGRPEGESLVPLLRGERAPALEGRSTLVHESSHNLQASRRDGNWKLVWPVATLREFLPKEPILFDLAADPDELRDVAAAHPEVVARLREPLEPWISAGKVADGEGSQVDEKAMQRLKALGYVN